MARYRYENRATGLISKEIVEGRLASGESLRNIARSYGISHQALCWRRAHWGCPGIRESWMKGDPSRSRFTDRWGYIMVRTSNRPGALAYTPEHVLVMERVLNRKLVRGEIIHHINGIKMDNRPENLILCTRIEHMKIHKDLEALAMELVNSGRIVFTERTYRWA